MFPLVGRQGRGDGVLVLVEGFRRAAGFDPFSKLCTLATGSHTTTARPYLTPKTLAQIIVSYTLQPCAVPVECTRFRNVPDGGSAGAGEKMPLSLYKAQNHIVALAYPGQRQS